ncbi:MAG: glycosyl transferase, partial [Gammaproteobacteria bacterium]
MPVTPLPLLEPPASLCLLRLSALGDVSHMVPVIRSIRMQWPDTRISWCLGRVEHQLVGDIDGIEF